MPRTKRTGKRSLTTSEQLRVSVLSELARRVRDAAAARGITYQSWMIWACETGIEVQARAAEAKAREAAQVLGNGADKPVGNADAA